MPTQIASLIDPSLLSGVALAIGIAGIGLWLAAAWWTYGDMARRTNSDLADVAAAYALEPDDLEPDDVDVPDTAPAPAPVPGRGLAESRSAADSRNPRSSGVPQKREAKPGIRGCRRRSAGGDRSMTATALPPLGLRLASRLVDPTLLVGSVAADFVSLLMDRVARILDGVACTVTGIGNLVAERLAVGAANTFLHVRFGVADGPLHVTHVHTSEGGGVPCSTGLTLP